MQINTATANCIYDVLVNICEAREGDRERFIYYVTNSARSHEYRFIGSLGFGGKLYRNSERLYVSCYSEDETPERRTAIEKANTELKVIHMEAQRRGAGE